MARSRPCRIETAALRTVEQWLNERRTLWEHRFDRLGQFLYVGPLNSTTWDRLGRITERIKKGGNILKCFPVSLKVGECAVGFFSIRIPSEEGLFQVGH